MDRELIKRKVKQIHDAAGRIRMTAWEVENNLDHTDFFGGDVFGTEQRAAQKTRRLELEINELADLMKELKEVTG